MVQESTSHTIDTHATATESTFGGETELSNSANILFFAGMSMHDFGNRALKNALEKIVPPEHAEVIPSLFSTDKVSPTRDADIQKAIEKVLLNAEHGVIVLYSMGAVEFVRALTEILQAHPESVSNLEHLDVVLMSPAGLIEGWSQMKQQVESLAILHEDPEDTDLPLQQQAQLSRLQRWWNRGRNVAQNTKRWLERYPAVLEGAVSPKKLLFWVETLNTFPPNPEILNESEVWKTLTELYPNDSQLAEDFTGEVIEVPAESWREILSDEELEKLDAIDRNIAQLLPTAQDSQAAIEALLRKRATLLQKPNNRVFSGEPVPGNETLTNETAAPWEMLAQMMLGFVSHSETLFSGDVIQQLNTLTTAGAKLHLLVPEYDRFVTIQDLAKLFPNETPTVLRGGTHITISNNTELLAEKLRTLVAQRAETQAPAEE